MQYCVNLECIDIPKSKKVEFECLGRKIPIEFSH